MKNILLFFLYCCTSIQLFAQCGTIIMYNGVIFTAANDATEYESIAINKEGRIIAVGSYEEMKAFKCTETKMINLEGKFVMPGLIEGHGHLLGIGSNLFEINLLNSNSWETACEALTQYKLKHPGDNWISGRGWHQEKWDKLPQDIVEGYPTNKCLNEICPDRPVVLSHASGHALIANQFALKAAGITQDTKDPEGGRILRDNEGNLTGVLEENAMDLIYLAKSLLLVSETTEQEYQHWLRYVLAAQEELTQYGITSFTDAGVTLKQLDFYKRAYSEKTLKNFRSWLMIRDYLIAIPRYSSPLPYFDQKDNLLQCRAFKAYADGALGSYGAALLKPYNDKKDHMGQVVTSIYDLKKMADIAKNKNMQLCIHAIGDRANRTVLDLYESVNGSRPNNDLRWRIEHAQHVDTSDFIRFAQLGVIASMQTVHCTSDAAFVNIRLGEERAKRTSYAWRTMLDNGVKLANGTDAPVESVSPFASIYAAMTRIIPKTQVSFNPEQCMTRREALLSYTIWNAYASFTEQNTGSLIAGKYADLVVLDRNLLTCEVSTVPDTKVLMVVFNGNIIK